MRSDLEAIVDVIGKGRRFLITSHVSPDGDAVGSELALYHLLRTLGKDVVVVNQDPVPAIYAFLPGSDAIRTAPIPEGPYDATILVDCGSPDRTGEVMAGDTSRLGTLVNIDHHATSSPWGNLNLIDPAASSTAELVHELIARAFGHPTLEMATCIYVGLMTDTGGFRYSNTSPEVLDLAARLLETGVDPAMLAKLVYDSVPFATLKLLGRALDSLTISADGRIAWISLTREDLAATGTDWEASEEFVSYPRSIPTVLLAMFFKEKEPGTVKVSLRSRGSLDVSAIAAAHGGGGHRNAAGCTITASLREARDIIIREVAALLGTNAPTQP